MTTIGFSLELASGALTCLADLPGVAACRHGQSVLLSDGKRLSRLGGDSDDGTSIAARFALPATDCGESGPKRLLGLILEGRFDGRATVSAVSEAGSALAGQAGPAGGEGLDGRAVARLGRGRGTRWQARVEASDGAFFDIGALTLVTLPLDRRLA